MEHWICVMIYPRDGKFLVLDSLDYLESMHKNSWYFYINSKSRYVFYIIDVSLEITW